MSPTDRYVAALVTVAVGVGVVVLCLAELVAETCLRAWQRRREAARRDG